MKEIELTDTVVTGDAIFAQKDICRAITKSDGDYFFVVKDNQAALKEHIATAFSPPPSEQRLWAHEVDMAEGREHFAAHRRSAVRLVRYGRIK